MRLGGIYNMEPLFNFHWAFMALGILRLYHYLILQPLSHLTEVNLNSMLCPAISDPFAGPWYRLAANIHQTFFIILHGKIYCFIGNKFFVPSATSTALVAEYYNIMNKVRESYRANSEGNSNNNECQKRQKDSSLSHNQFKILSYYDEEEEDNHLRNEQNSSSDSSGSENTTSSSQFACQEVGAKSNGQIKED
jgi:hypothetical protein